MRLRERIFNILLAGAVTILLFFAITYEGWGCGGRILEDYCKRFKHFQILGPLLLASCIFVAASAILTLMGLFIPITWSDKVALLCAFVCTALTTSSVVYYHYYTGQWLPYLAATSMGISLTQAVILTADRNRSQKSKSVE
ncbi:hypothetical protein ECG_07258 [Echinococcus granulosus]|uniref:Expressed conserved protein n=1 Tax=Echinococcus granulosus TaxID=6210 RepID=A0A068WWB4_ECHGR|nr:hypothetical protein ECG_07258 [Echinococcus granulosus]CDS21926.1 hypothetical protein EgrG_002022600 [Echinococcus granulosus]